MKKTLWLLTVTFFFYGHSSTAGQFDHQHQLWSNILKEFVQTRGNESRVDYARLKAKPSQLNEYITIIEGTSQTEFENFSQNEKLSFLINAYNALTVKLIVDHYPVKSIKDLGGIFSSPWKKEFFKLLGKKRTLDEIEHELIRPKFNEPRIHFALVCASIGCPPLRSEPFIADHIEKQLENSAVNFLKDSGKNKVDIKQGRLELSSIFKWYGEDFVKVYGSVENYISTRITEVKQEQEAIRMKKLTISFLPYDWNLNDSKANCSEKVCKR